MYLIIIIELGHFLTRSGLVYPEVSSKVYHDSFCQLRSSVSLPWVIYLEACCLHVVSSFSCIPVICPKLVSFLTPLQFVHLFYNLSKCILLFFSCISSLLLLFFWCCFCTLFEKVICGKALKLFFCNCTTYWWKSSLQIVHMLFYFWQTGMFMTVRMLPEVSVHTLISESFMRFSNTNLLVGHWHRFSENVRKMNWDRV